MLFSIVLVFSVQQWEISTSHVSYQKVLLEEMKALVDAFYSDMSNKISSIKREQQRAIREKETQLKYDTRHSKSAECRKEYSAENSSSAISSNLTVSSWASEKQHEKHKQLLQLLSESTSCEKDPQWDLPSFAVENLNANSSSFEHSLPSQTFPGRVISVQDARCKDSFC